MSSPKFESDEFESDDFDAVEPIDTPIGDLAEAESSDIGLTSAESAKDSDETNRASVENATEKSVEHKYDLSLFDVLLLVSLVCVTLATILMFFALGEYGNIFTSYPWRV